MKRKAAEPDAHQMLPAASEELSRAVNGEGGPPRSQSGWDPYEVWRTRVKGFATVRPERERDPWR